MKKLITLLCFALLFLVSSGQQVDRQMVVVEIGTGTWCPFCPGSAMGADDLIEQGYDVAVIEYHYGDDFQNTYSSSRVSYYNITGFPTAFFDGLLPVVGGDGSESMFPSYYPRVNQRMSVPSSFTLTMEGSHTCLETFTAGITLEKVASYSGTNLVLHAVLTESHIEESWQGMSELNYVCRRMYPNQSGTPVSFAGGNTQTFSFEFTPDPSWNTEEMEMVVFLQDNNSKGVLQASKMPLMDFIPETILDAGVAALISLPESTCGESVESVVVIKNTGSAALSALSLNYSVNGGEAQTYDWNGMLDYLQQDTVTLPAITFEVEEENAITVTCSDPNGGSDECSGNDQVIATIIQGAYTLNTVKILIRTGANPQETTWEVLSPSGEVLYQGGPYSVAGQMINETFELAEEGCHTFRIYDAGGDGFIIPGFYLLYHGSNDVISDGIGFGPVKSVDFNTSDVVGLTETPVRQGVRLYPNPANDRVEIDLNMHTPGIVRYSISNLTGKQIIQTDLGMLHQGIYHETLNTNSLAPGIYFYTVRSGAEVFTGKLVITR